MHYFKSPIRFAGFVMTVAWTFNANGQITSSFTEPLESIEVAAAQFGIVSEILVSEGDQVKKGQLLGRMNSVVLQQSLRLAKTRATSDAKIKAAHADVALKQSRFEKLKPLLADGHANPTEVEQAQTEYKQAIAALQVAKDAQIESKIEVAKIEAEISQREIRSPIDGTVIDVHRRPGEYLPANDPKFATIVQTKQLRCRFFVATNVATKLSKGQTLQLRIAGKSQLTDAKVQFVSPVTHAESGTARIDLLIQNFNQEHRSGIRCDLVPFDQLRSSLGNSKKNDSLPE